MPNLANGTREGNTARISPDYRSHWNPLRHRKRGRATTRRYKGRKLVKKWEAQHIDPLIDTGARNKEAKRVIPPNRPPGRAPACTRLAPCSVYEVLSLAGDKEKHLFGHRASLRPHGLTGRRPLPDPRCRPPAHPHRAGPAPVPRASLRRPRPPLSPLPARPADGTGRRGAAGRNRGRHRGRDAAEGRRRRGGRTRGRGRRGRWGRGKVTGEGGGAWAPAGSARGPPWRSCCAAGRRCLPAAATQREAAASWLRPAAPPARLRRLAAHPAGCAPPPTAAAALALRRPPRHRCCRCPSVPSPPPPPPLRTAEPAAAAKPARPPNAPSPRDTSGEEGPLRFTAAPAGGRRKERGLPRGAAARARRHEAAQWAAGAGAPVAAGLGHCRRPALGDEGMAGAGGGAGPGERRRAGARGRAGGVGRPWRSGPGRGNRTDIDTGAPGNRTDTGAGGKGGGGSSAASPGARERRGCPRGGGSRRWGTRCLAELKKASKRLTCHKRYKIQKKVGPGPGGGGEPPGLPLPHGAGRGGAGGGMLHAN